MSDCNGRIPFRTTKLSPEIQEILNNRTTEFWKDTEDLTYEQIAEATGISKGYINRVLIKVAAQTVKLEYQKAKEMHVNARTGEKGVAISAELVDKINTLLSEKDRATNEFTPIPFRVSKIRRTHRH